MGFNVMGAENLKNVDKHCRPFSNDKDAKRHETEEERRIRKEKEREERHKKEGRPKETEEERAARKEKERKDRDSKRKTETEEERAIRKEKERKEKDERYRKEGRRKETEEERKIRKEAERHKMEGGRKETEEERRIRKERERAERHNKEGRKEETEEERRIRKERERIERHQKEGRSHETEEDRRIRKEKERKERGEKHRSHSKEEQYKSRNETEEERRIRKENEKKQRKEREAQELAQRIKQERDLQREMDAQEFENEANNNHNSTKKRKNHDSDEEYSPFDKKKKGVVKNEIKSESFDEKENRPLKIKIKTEQSSQKFEQRNVKEEVEFKDIKKEEPGEKVKWWEQEKTGGKSDKKWHFLQHNGVLFAPDYEPLPDHVRFYYDKQPIRLSTAAEEIATFYGRMLDHDYTTKEVFNRNFFKDWRRAMNEKERKLIRDLSICDFTEIDAHFKSVSEQRKARGKEERKAEKLKTEAIAKEYGVCMIAYDKNEAPYEEKIGNFRIEPPGLFRGRGEHPKQGCVKLRVLPEDVTINISKDATPPKPPKGHNWKKIQHDNTVTWLATWTENVQNQNKYVMLNPSSKMKAENDMLKYEKARRLKDKIDEIRANYTADWKSKEMAIRQRAVALYFIDKLALRAGHEKGEDQADTVGCCSLRVEHLTLHEEKDGKQCVVEFDFLGKDSIRYFNSVPVEKRVFKNLKLFMENKKPQADLFDRLNTESLNDYLRQLMPDLSAKVFRTYNASITLQEQLLKLTEEEDNVMLKVLSYNRANREVAILCNHQKAVSKTFDKTMENLQGKIDLKREAVEKAENDYKAMKKEFKRGGQCAKADVEKKKKMLETVMEQLNKLETQQTDKEENKTVSLGTSKLNYMDPRISVAWCKKWNIPIQKVFTTKTHREKFQWAIEMVDADYVF